MGIFNDWEQKKCLLDRQWLIDALSDALEALSETVERLEDERLDLEEILLDDLANVYAKLNFAVNTAETGPAAIDTTDHDELIQWPECMPFDRDEDSPQMS